MLAPWKKSYDQPRQHIQKQRHYFANKGPSSQSYLTRWSKVVMYRCKNWIKKAECWSIEAFKLWCWRKLLRVPWTAKRSNQSILKKTNPEYSLEGLMLKLNSNTLGTWCKEPTHWKRPWCWERLRARGEGSDRRWDGWMTSPTQWTWIWANPRRWWRTRKSGMLQSRGLQRVRHEWATEQQQSKPNGKSTL